ncbi:alpha-galactosidase [Herbiconiux liukaitaii]|uniref:alpha-galactosidase n=1 Tax=Herbiconiux liukaitaii TaxID=3342799 RepID=UPI0035B973FC
MTTEMILLRAAGSSIVLDARGTGVPTVLHWGADLGELSESELADFADSRAPAVSPSSIDVPLRPSLLPGLAEGWSGRPGMSGSAVAGTSGRAPHFELAGVERPTATSVVIRLEQADQAAAPVPVQLGVTIELELTQHGVLRMRMIARNDSALTTGAASWQLDSLDAMLPLPGRATELLDFTGRWPRERQPQRRPLGHGTWLRESRHGRPGHDDAFLLVAGTPGFGFRSGEVWAAHLAWSGDKRLWAEAQATGLRMLGGGELLEPGELVLEPGEEYSTPWLVTAWSDEGLDGLSARLHAYARAQSPTDPNAPRKVMLNTWEAVYFDHSEERLGELADTAASVGVERFVLDDGWMLGRVDDTRALGDWIVDPVKWPAGLHPLVDRVHALGMDFGLWVEPEMVSLDSQVARAHPEWVLSGGDRLPLPWRHQHVLDLANAEAFAHVLGQLDALLDEYPIAYLKWDQNRDLLGGSAHAQTLACYRLMDELRARHPGLEIESCSSGGGRVDLGVMQRTDRVWPSDTNDPLERQTIERYTTLLVPHEYFGAHLGAATAHTTGRTHDLGFRLATALFGHAGIEWDLTRATAAEREAVAQWIAVYKRFRGLLRTGAVVRDDPADPLRWVHGVVARDASEALFSVVALGSSSDAVPSPTLFAGLDPERRYRVAPVDLGAPVRFIQDAPPAWWSTGSVVATGRQLAVAGLPLPLLAPEQALVLHITEVGA